MTSASARRARRARRARPTVDTRELIAYAIVAVLAVVAALGFGSIYANWSFVPAAIVGAVGAGAVAVFGRSRGWSSLDTLVVSLLGFGVLGPIAAGGLPTGASISAFPDGLVHGWARVLSTTPPIDVTAALRVLPFVVAWAGTTAGAELLRARRAPGLAIVGPLAGFGLASLITLERHNLALGQGAALALGALLLVTVDRWRDASARRAAAAARSDARREDGDTAEEGERTHDVVAANASSPANEPDRRALVAAGGAAIAVAIVALFVGPHMPLASANERFDLREVQEPPFDPLETPSPLVQVKAALQEANADTVMFTVTASEPVERFPLAVLDHYTDEFWAVAREGDAAARFRPVDSLLPPPSDVPLDGWHEVSATVEIAGLDEIAGGEFDPPWMPTLGWPVEVGADRVLDLRADLRTGTLALVPDGPGEGLVYDIVSAVPPPTGSLDLRAAAVTLEDPLDLAVPQLRELAGDVLEGADQGWEQVEAIRATLVDTGAYDSRAGSFTARPGHSLGRLAEFVDDPERIVGFEEQYAATAALLARSVGLPARVVVGFRIDPDEAEQRWTDDRIEVRANDMAAWIEVRFDDLGWLPFDVTPPRDREPDDSVVGRTRREVAIPNPPPDPPPPVLPPQLDQEQPPVDTTPPASTDPPRGDGFPWRTATIAGGAAMPVLLLVAAAVTIVALKRRRTMRRRTARTTSARIIGAWREVVERYEEAGVRRRRDTTPNEFVRGLAAADVVEPEIADGLLDLARDLDDATYHPEPRPETQAEHAWKRSDDLVAAIRSERGVLTRMRRDLDPRPLLRRDPVIDDDPAIEDDLSDG